MNRKGKQEEKKMKDYTFNFEINANSLKEQRNMLKEQQKENFLKWKETPGPLTKKMKNYLVKKDFSLGFIETLTKEDYFNRMDSVEEAKEKFLDFVRSLKLENVIVSDDENSITVDGIKYLFHQEIDKEQEQDQNTHDLMEFKEIANNQAISDMLDKYLEEYFPKKETFEKLISNGFAYDINIGKERTRFNMTVKDFKHYMKMFKEDQKFLKDLQRGVSPKDLYNEGLIDTPYLDLTRSKEYEEAMKELQEIGGETILLARITSKTNFMLNKVYVGMSYPTLYGYDDDINPLILYRFIKEENLYALEEIGKISQEIAREGAMNGFRRLGYFQIFEDEGLIPPQLVQFLACVDAQEYNRFIEWRNAQ